jgi:nitrite reductase (cytochrome c-552)
MPDLSSKEKAQAYVGIDLKKLKGEKEEWKKNVLPKWLQLAKEREQNMPLPERIM